MLLLSGAHGALPREKAARAVSSGEECFIADIIYNGQLLVIIETAQLSLDIVILLNALQPVH